MAVEEAAPAVQGCLSSLTKTDGSVSPLGHAKPLRQGDPNGNSRQDQWPSEVGRYLDLTFEMNEVKKQSEL